jgi:AcrR family transcriptional regulator
MPSVTRKSHSDRAKRRDEITSRMLAAVETLLEADDATYTALSVERLIGEAEISRSTFYVYFEDKGALLLALTEDVIADLVAACAYWWQLPADATQEDLHEAMRRIVDAYLPHRVVLAAVVEATAYDPNIRETFRAMMNGVIAQVTDHVRQGQQQGFVRADLDPRRTAGWLTWMTERGLYQLVSPGSPSERHELLASLTDVVWHTLYAGSASRV